MTSTTPALHHPAGWSARLPIVSGAPRTKSSGLRSKPLPAPAGRHGHLGGLLHLPVVAAHPRMLTLHVTRLPPLLLQTAGETVPAGRRGHPTDPRQLPVVAAHPPTLTAHMTHRPTQTPPPVRRLPCTTRRRRQTARLPFRPCLIQVRCRPQPRWPLHLNLHRSTRPSLGGRIVRRTGCRRLVRLPPCFVVAVAFASRMFTSVSFAVDGRRRCAPEKRPPRRGRHPNPVCRAGPPCAAGDSSPSSHGGGFPPRRHQRAEASWVCSQSCTHHHAVDVAAAHGACRPCAGHVAGTVTTAPAKLRQTRTQHSRDVAAVHVAVCRQGRRSHRPPPR